MYQITIAVTNNPIVIETDKRVLAGALYQVALANPDKLEVTVATLAKPKPTKFKNLPAQAVD